MLVVANVTLSPLPKMPPSALLNIDKPAGITSHDVVAQIRRIVRLRRVGHAGTLDPLATGVLVIAVGRATRLLEYVVGQPKTYLATIRLGQTTTTYDAEGEVASEQPVNVTPAGLAAALAQFRGDILQIPPMYSAVKQDGQTLYKLARQGIEVDRPPRPVTIYDLNLQTWAGPLVTLRIVCSAGTYIRSIAHDLGQVLGCGAYLSGLRRTAVGPFTTATATPLASLATENWPEYALPPEMAIAHLPRLAVSAAAAAELRYGRLIDRPPGSSEELVCAYDPAGAFVGILTASGPHWQPHKIWSQ